MAKKAAKGENDANKAGVKKTKAAAKRVSTTASRKDTKPKQASSSRSNKVSASSVRPTGRITTIDTTTGKTTTKTLKAKKLPAKLARANRQSIIEARIAKDLEHAGHEQTKRAIKERKRTTPNTRNTTEKVVRKSVPQDGDSSLPNRKRKFKKALSDRPTGPAPTIGPHPDTVKPSISEVGAEGTIGNPVPRTGPIKDITPIEQMLNIKWSKYLYQTPTPKQTAAMMLAWTKEVLYGGALGGGKSDWLAYEALRYCDLPGFSSIIFRRQLTDLKQPKSLIPRIADWLGPFAERGECRYIGDEHKWVFKTYWPNTDIPGPPAMLQFGYIGEASVRERYQSAEYHLVCFDELGQWPDATDYLFMRSRIRKTVCPIHGKDVNGIPIYITGCRYCDVQRQIPLRMRAASNPGPPWIKRRFGIIPDPTQFPNRHAALIAISEGHKVRWVGTIPGRPFIPAYLDDNPHLDAKDYREMLAEMTEDERSRLEDGNWEARKNARFKRRWQLFYELYPEIRQFAMVDTDIYGTQVTGEPIPFHALRKVYTTTDPAVTTKQGPVDGQLKQKNSHAVISTWGDYNGQLLWMDMRKFRKEIPDLVEQLVEVNGIWQPLYNKIECNGVGIGVAQYAEAAGLRVTKNYRKNDKLENSMSAQILMKAGRIRFPLNMPWLEECEDDVFNWTGLPEEDDDVIDTMSDAANDLSLEVAREISAPDIRRSAPRAVSTRSYGSGKLPHYGFY